MARARNVKPGFFKNEMLAEIDPVGRLLFIGLWTIADRDGRLEDRPKRIKGELFPYDSFDVDQYLNELAKHGFILRYELEGNKYIQVINFKKHQNPHVKESASTIPAPDSHHTSHADSLIPLSLIPSKQPCASADALEGFSAFWKAYPKKKSKGQAEKAWKKIRPDEQFQAQILQALERAKKSELWTRDNGRYIQYPATWLNAKCWEDEDLAPVRKPMFAGAK